MALHVLSDLTAAGDEIGYAFQDSMLNGGQTFSGFCRSMTNQYQRTFRHSRRFMSHVTFIKFWISWAVSHQYDFIMPCPVCQFTPKYIAMDGTRTGICLKNANFPAIERTSNSTPIPSIHKSADRCFINHNSLQSKESLKNVRAKLLQISKIAGPNKDIAKKVFKDDDERDQFFTIIPLLAREELSRCIDGKMEKETFSFAKLIHYMSSTVVSVTNMILPKYVQSVIAVLDNINRRLYDTEARSLVEMHLNEMGLYSRELKDYLQTIKLLHDEIPSSALNFVRHLCNRVSHLQFTEPEPISEMPRSYNPPVNGSAYYYNQGANQIRQCRMFDIDKEVACDERSSEENCKKYYVRASGKGQTFLFLHFCPLHHHCYGFHMVNGGEGRKDVMASLYSFLEKSPDVLYYDNACQASQYILNRESGFFKDTLVFHDIFHSYSHKCPDIFKSNRLESYSKCNTSICEQFNRYIKYLRPSASHMGQGTFTFCLQYFIHKWNMDKKERYQNIIRIANASME